MEVEDVMDRKGEEGGEGTKRVLGAIAAHLCP